MRHLLLFSLLLLVYLFAQSPAVAAPSLAPAQKNAVVAHGAPVDQHSSAACSGYALANFMAGGAWPHTLLNGEALYEAAKVRDGNDYAGTSLAQVVGVLQRWGYLGHTTYSNAVLDGVAHLTQGEGFVVGMEWTTGMDQPTAAGVITGTGTVRAAHATFCFAYDARTHRVACQNSWGGQWGKGGTFQLDVGVMQRLLQTNSVVLPERNHYRRFRWTLWSF